MIKAEINKTRIKAEIPGDAATILGEIHGFLYDVLGDMEKAIGEPKQHLLTMLYQNILKEWSNGNENE